MSSDPGKRALRPSALATVVALTAFLVQVAIPAAAAAPPPTVVGSISPVWASSFDNDFTASGVTHMNLVSDRAGPAELRAISSHTVGATQMTWFDCGAGSGPPKTQGPFALGDNCVQDGQDATPTLATISTVTSLTRADIDDAWSTPFDVPARLAGQERDLVVVGCNGTPLSNFGNCTADTVTTWFDDAGTSGANATSSGRITAISPSFSDTPGAVHGVAVSDSTGFGVSATTSPELTEVAFAVDSGGSFAVTAARPQGNLDVDENDFDVSDAPTTTTATAKTWTTTHWAGAVIDPETTAALTLSGTDNGSFRTTLPAPFSSCNAVGGDVCAMDRVYLVSEDGGGGPIGVAPPPTVTSFDPTSGPIGASVTIKGTNFAGAGFTTTAVTFNDVEATFTVVSATRITATVPAAATTGKIAVTTPGGRATSSAAFVVGTLHPRSVSLSLSNRPFVASGRVSASDGFSACVSNVRVKIQRRKIGGGWLPVKSTRTNGSGGFGIRLPDVEGTYRATVARVSLNGGVDICRRAISPAKRHR